MATYIVTGVRKEACGDGVHRHIEGVCTESGTHHTRRQVVDSINAGKIWKTKAGGYEATIRKMAKCRWCNAVPYIETVPDSTKLDNLEHLPAC